MIGVTIVMRAVPSKGDALAALLEEVAAEVMAEDPGCTQFTVMRNEKDPEEFAIFEQYLSHEAFIAHEESDLAKRVGPKFEGLRVKPPRVIVVGPVIAA